MKMELHYLFLINIIMKVSKVQAIIYSAFNQFLKAMSVR